VSWSSSGAPRGLLPNLRRVPWSRRSRATSWGVKASTSPASTASRSFRRAALAWVTVAQLEVGVQPPRHHVSVGIRSVGMVALSTRPGSGPSPLLRTRPRVLDNKQGASPRDGERSVRAGHSDPTSAPAVAGGTLFVASGTTLNAFDASRITNSAPIPQPTESMFGDSQSLLCNCRLGHVSQQQRDLIARWQQDVRRLERGLRSSHRRVHNVVRPGSVGRARQCHTGPKFGGYGVKPRPHLLSIAPISPVLLGHSTGRKALCIGCKTTSEGDVATGTNPLHQCLDPFDGRDVTFAGRVVKRTRGRSRWAVAEARPYGA
jgi:hypothetical protein